MILKHLVLNRLHYMGPKAASIGLAYRPAMDSIAVVTDSVACQAVVDSYNASRPDSTHWVQTGYVISTSPGYVLINLERCFSAYFNGAFKLLSTAGEIECPPPGRW
jgi:hypothetical protein